MRAREVFADIFEWFFFYFGSMCVYVVDLMHFPVHVRSRKKKRNSKWSEINPHCQLSQCTRHIYSSYLPTPCRFLLIHLVFTWRWISITELCAHCNKMDIKALKWLRLCILFCTFFFCTYTYTKSRPMKKKKKIVLCVVLLLHFMLHGYLW